MSYADNARAISGISQQVNKERIDSTAEKIAQAFIEKIKCPNNRSPGILSPDGKSFSCGSHCSGMEVAEMRAVAARLGETPYDFKVDSEFDYNRGNRIVISI